MLDAPARGTGKGLLAEVISVVATGFPGHVMSLPRDDDELEKRITAALLAGRQVIHLDNVRRLQDLARSGNVVGKIYAVSTVGSILGAFLTGFVLIQWMGTRPILLLVGLVLVLMALVFGRLWQALVPGMVPEYDGLPTKIQTNLGQFYYCMGYANPGLQCFVPAVAFPTHKYASRGNAANLHSNPGLL